MKTSLLGILGGGIATCGLLIIGGLAGYAYAHWEADFQTSSETTMDDLTASCVAEGGFSYKGYGYYCSLDEDGKRDLADARKDEVET